MKKPELIAAILFASMIVFPEATCSSGPSAVLSDAKAEFERVEGMLLNDGLDSARDYFAYSDKAYAEIAGKISALENEKLSSADRADCLFMLVVISLRKPDCLSIEKARNDYLSVIRNNIDNEEVKTAFFGHVVYLSETVNGIPADTFIDGLTPGGNQTMLYREAGEYALGKGKPEVAFLLFSRYLAAVYVSEGPEYCSSESKKLEEEFKGRDYTYYSGQLEMKRLRISVENAADRSEAVGVVKEKAAFLYRQGNAAEAVELYELAYEAGGDDRSLSAIGDIYLESGKYEMALQKYQGYPGAEDNPEILFKMALCNRKIGENSASYSMFKKIESGHKDSEYYDDALYHMGVLNKEAGLFEESERYFEKLRTEKPGSEYVVTE